MRPLPTTLALSLLLPLTAAANTSFEGTYDLAGRYVTYSTDVKTSAELQIKLRHGKYKVERKARYTSGSYATKPPFTWRSVHSRKVGKSLHVVYRLPRGTNGLVGGVTGAGSPAPSYSFVATYRFSNGGLSESVWNFTRKDDEWWWRTVYTFGKRRVAGADLDAIDQALARVFADSNLKTALDQLDDCESPRRLYRGRLQAKSLQDATAEVEGTHQVNLTASPKKGIGAVKGLVAEMTDALDWGLDWQEGAEGALLYLKATLRAQLLPVGKFKSVHLLKGSKSVPYWICHFTFLLVETRDGHWYCVGQERGEED